MTTNEKIEAAIESLGEREEDREGDWTLKGRFEDLGLDIDSDTITQLSFAVAGSSQVTLEVLMQRGVPMHEAAVGASVVPLIMGMELYKELLVKA